MEKSPHWYLHVDLDAFFASVEQLDNPEYRGKPVIVGGLPEDRRSVVSTASYEARKYGVHSAMPTFQAYKLCPNGIFVHGRMHRYAELSYQIMNIFRDFSPDVDQMSIDEAFIDLTGTEKLFGPPEETAQKIKERVKKETGLTVSMGLATTKYLAKIASGLFKPDGFCHIKSGEEQNFMLNLPLNKVWGLGPKSLELIKSKGFRTTRDLYERDYDTLEFLFGKNMAGFIYNVVRGIEKESFSRQTKSHSISAETTFPYDLTDIYMIETELMELAHGVFFRLLKEEAYSRTAFVKIRYDDFSTCTVQETVERNIITLDSYFEIIKRLFEKKYENGRGIRLLGVGFENVVKEEKPYQQDLFDNNDEKKQAVEKAILKLSKKHPEIKVQKARTLKAILFLFLTGFAALKTEAHEVDFTASGLWKSEVSTGLNFTFGNGTTPTASPQLPLFKQEVDLQTLITLDDSWYFQADFADEFTTNTFAFGYKSDNLIRHFRVANRGITMGTGYSAEYFGYGLQGGNNQAPGMSLFLMPENERWQADFLVRYDMTEVKSATYYGMNKASDQVLSPADFLYGREFRFPEGTELLLSQIEDVYVESEGGKWRDAEGRKYRKLGKDEFAALTGAKRLFISKDAGGGKNSDGKVPAVIVTFATDSAVNEMIFSCGSYDNSETFLGKIQSELGLNRQYQLQDYTGSLSTAIEDHPALILQENGHFSPFLCPSLYDTGKYETDFFVQAGKSGNRLYNYKAVSSEDFYTSLYEDFFNEKSHFTQIINTNSEKSVYPFAEVCPEIYLGLPAKTSLELLSRTYTPVKEIIIPKTAVSGTVQVYRNGILLPGIIFNENTGVIQLNTPVSPTDKLVVTWQEDSSDFENGAVALGAGFKIKILPFWNADVSITAHQNVNQKDIYTNQNNQKNSFITLTAGTQIEKDGFKFSEKANIAVLDENTSKGQMLYSYQELCDDCEQNKKEKPEKKSAVSFNSADFSSYKKIIIDVDFSSLKTAFAPPLFLIFDEDTGTSEKGRKAISLQIKDDSVLQNKAAHKIIINLEDKTVQIDDFSLSQDAYELYISNAVLPSRLIAESTNNEEIFITQLSFDEAKPYGAFRNYVAAEYQKTGTVLQAGSFDIINDFKFHSESVQGNGNFDSPDFFVNTKTDADITITRIKLSGDLTSEKTDIAQAGHSIKTDGKLFDVISAEDTFRKDYFSDEVYKQNAVALNFNKIKVPVQTSFKTNASSTPFYKKQNAELALDYAQPIFSYQFLAGAKASASQTVNESSESEKYNYAESWKDISQFAFSTGSENASLRNNSYSAYIGGIIHLGKTEVSFKPKLSGELTDNYNSSLSGIVFADKEQLKLSLPFSGNKKAFSFDIARTGGGTQPTQRGGTYSTDTRELFALQDQRTWFYTQVPFYELFDKSLNSALPQNTSYSTKYEAIFRRSLYNSLKDLYIPAAVSLAVDRELTNLAPASDLYQFKAVITNNSINNFGSTSINRNFLWFRQEELTTSLSAILKLPAADFANYKLRIQAFSQLLLYISDNANLSEVFDLAIDNTADWNLRDTITYTRPSKNSLISDLVKICFPEAGRPASNMTISRKDSFTFDIGKIENNLHQKYGYDHTVSVQFMEFYSIFSTLGGTLVLNQKKADQFNFTLTIGAAYCRGAK